MKTIIPLLVVLFVISSCKNDVQLSNPESVCYLENTKTHIVSNYGNGSIVKVEGNKKKAFVSGYSPFMGIAYQDGKVYVAEDVETGDDYIRVFDVKTTKELSAIKVIGSQQLNDVVLDSKGNLYVSDRNDHKIYKIDLKQGSYEVISENMINTPNGLYLLEKENKLLVCNTVLESSVYSLDLSSLEMALVHSTNYPHFDGITVDNQGNIYVSSWAADWSSSKLLKFVDGKPTVVYENNGMADISYNPTTNKIDVANFYENAIQSIGL